MRKNLPILSLFFLLLIFSTHGWAQQAATLVFKEIVYGNTNVSTRTPDRLDLQVNEGVIEFSVQHKTDCRERYKISYKFLQDMTAIPVYLDKESKLDYELKVEALDKPCFAYDYYLFRNAWVSAANDAAGSSSGLKYILSKKGEWKYTPNGQFITDRSPYVYAHPAKSTNQNGSYRGAFKVLKINTNYINSDRTFYTDVYFNISAPSPLGGLSNGFDYNIILVYELVAGVVEGTGNSDPCAIQEPDCSCCPGTIPVWNFKTNQGECMCPEGTKWNKINNRCETN